MATQTIRELQAKSEAAWKNLTTQLTGIEPYMERSDAPGEWTVREVLSHLLGDQQGNLTRVLRSFAQRDLPVIDLNPGETFVTAERKGMTLAQFLAALEADRRDAFAYLGGLSEAELHRKARIPMFKSFMGTDEIALPMFAGAVFEYHVNDHAGQIAKIRKAVGLPAM
jgi:hypothetical protein